MLIVGNWLLGGFPKRLQYRVFWVQIFCCESSRKCPQESRAVKACDDAHAWAPHTTPPAGRRPHSQVVDPCLRLPHWPSLWFFWGCVPCTGGLRSELRQVRFRCFVSCLFLATCFTACKFLRQIPFFLYDFSNSTVLPAGWALPQTRESTDICLQLQISQFSREATGTGRLLELPRAARI
jgi:hypothetical protein